MTAVLYSKSGWRVVWPFSRGVVGLVGIASLGVTGTRVRSRSPHPSGLCTIDNTQ